GIYYSLIQVKSLQLYILFHLHLFYLFLSEASVIIHYDYQVLLDYLISKDTGIRCAKYLL
ncbi:hypothetical protein S245_001276, partial [Arachis hypogaea]